MVMRFVEGYWYTIGNELIVNLSILKWWSCKSIKTHDLFRISLQGIYTDLCSGIPHTPEHV